MENKHVGYILLGVAALLVVIIFLFQNALRGMVSATCSMEASTCPMNTTISQQTWLALAIVGIIVVVGGVLIFTKPKEKIVIKKFKEKKKKMELSGLDNKEKEIMKILEEENGTIFQAELMEKLGFGKVGVTRLLDKLEAKQFIERKRRGMNNVVVLKN